MSMKQVRLECSHCGNAFSSNMIGRRHGVNNFCTNKCSISAGILKKKVDRAKENSIPRKCANTTCKTIFVRKRKSNTYCSDVCAKSSRALRLLESSVGKDTHVINVRESTLTERECKVCKSPFLATTGKYSVCAKTTCTRELRRDAQKRYEKRKSLGLVSIPVIPRASTRRKGIPASISMKRTPRLFICRECGSEFTAYKFNEAYCQRKCFKKAYYKRGKDLLPPPPVCVDIPGEKWKDIPTLIGQFEVSNLGRIRQSFSNNRKNRSRTFWPGVIRQPLKVTSGFNLIQTTWVTSNNHKATYMPVHILVATVFIPNPLSLPFVRHIDGDRSNNSVMNLFWSDSKGVPIKSKIHYKKACPVCKDKFSTTYSLKVYCSKDCQYKVRDARIKVKYSEKDTSVLQCENLPPQAVNKKTLPVYDEVSRKCQQCNEKFVVSMGPGGSRRRIYCSVKCRNDFNNILVKKRLKESLKVKVVDNSIFSRIKSMFTL